MEYEDLKIIEEKAAALGALADGVWEHPETAFTEFVSAGLLADSLEKEGFAVTRGVADIPTAFSARYGSGRPVIGLLGEFDALSGLSQKAGVAQPCPLEAGGNGHGCGHNLLGVGSLAAALAVKQYLQRTGASGTVIYYGCPGEEGGSGKAFMARSGVFGELDCALSWHPAEVTNVMQSTTLANIQVLYTFEGIAAHAAGCPEKGRSALDAMELMNVGTNFLREHMIDAARIHYAIIDGGGISPNVVQPHASVLYLIRAPRTEQAQELYRRVNLIAQGMAMATETKVHWELIKTCAELIPNLPLEQQLAQSFAEIQAPEVTDEELAFLRSITASSTSPKSELLQKALDRLERPENRAAVEQRLAEDFHGQPLPYEPKLVPPVEGGSTDVGDVSWQCPTAQIHTATWAPSSGGHTWQIVAQGKSTVAHKYMCYCGKVLGQTAIRLLQQPQTLAQARAAWEKELTGRSYLPIPPEVKPRAISSL